MWKPVSLTHLFTVAGMTVPGFSRFNCFYIKCGIVSALQLICLYKGFLRFADFECREAFGHSSYSVKTDAHSPQYQSPGVSSMGLHINKFPRFLCLVANHE